MLILCSIWSEDMMLYASVATKTDRENRSVARVATNTTEVELQEQTHALKQKKQKQVVPRQKHCVAAILNPVEFDNYKLWSLLSKKLTEQECKHFTALADLTMKDHKVLSAAKYTFWPDIDIFYPELALFMELLAYHRFDMKKIATIFKDCLIVSAAPQALAFWLNRKENQNINSRGPQTDNPPPPIPPNNNNLFLGDPNFHFNPQQVRCTINMQILAGFITVLGIAAVAVAFTALNAATFGIPLAGVGVVAILCGMGLFAFGHNANNKQYQAVQNNMPGAPAS